MNQIEPTEPPRIGPILWRQRYLILASIVLLLALALVYTEVASKTYQATAIIEVNLPTSNLNSSDTTSTDQALAKDYATLLTSQGFLRTIADQTRPGGFTLATLESNVAASSTENSALITMKTTGATPAAARAIATDVVNGFLAHLQASAASTTTKLQTQLQQQIAALTAKVNALAPHLSDPTVSAQANSLRASRQALIEQSATLVANGLAQGTSATLSAPPSASADPISPKRWLDILAGLILGSVLGVGLAWAREALRPAIHSAGDLTSLTDLPVLASIPLNARDEQALTDAYRVLYTNLRFLLRANDGCVVTAVSLHAKVGKSSTVEGLARVAGNDRSVLVVDGDVRTGTLSQRLGYGDHPGLVEVLTEAGSLDDAIVRLDDGVSLLPARPPHEDLPGLFSWRRTLAVMSLLRERFDLVLIDSPPLAGLADGLILASQSDSVLLVVRAGLTRPADIAAAANRLQHNKTPIAGLVVFEELAADSYYPFAGQETRTSPIQEAL
jgi:Mrp family chromosome partitioning ATPase/LPS O-antigen subunit length determinant protein (WzzB/FepE family)